MAETNYNLLIILLTGDGLENAVFTPGYTYNICDTKSYLSEHQQSIWKKKGT